MTSAIKPQRIVSMDANLAEEIRKELSVAASEITALQAEITADAATTVTAAFIAADAVVTAYIDAGKALAEALAADATGAISILKKTTVLALTSGTDKAITLADGVAGQEKIITLASRSGAGNYVLTPAHPLTFATLTFNLAGDSVHLVFNGTAWAIVSNNSAVVA